MGVRFQFCMVLISLVVNVPDSAAWGPQGHSVIGLIADGHLKPEVKELIAEKFNINSLADVATWADRTRKKRKEESSWHYTNIEEGEWTYNAERDCPDGACVTEKIHEFSGILRSTSLRERKKDALKFLVHFVGDVHQPLHLGNLKDRGGGTLRFLYKGKDVSLHYLWDGGLIDWDGEPPQVTRNMFISPSECVDGLTSHCYLPPSLEGGEPPQVNERRHTPPPKARSLFPPGVARESLLKYAARLNGRVSEEEVSAWSLSTVSDWANESRSLALKVAYRVDKGGLSKAYIKRGREVINLRLTQAGVRLAHLLNTILTF